MYRPLLGSVEVSFSIPLVVYFLLNRGENETSTDPSQAKDFRVFFRRFAIRDPNLRHVRIH